jgi:S-adenosyl-L-methionine hydrolase (adenosine-forming)
VSPIITLTTDFGTRDSYVAEMKGVILGLAPTVRLIDVSHEVEPQQITEGALAVEAAASWFPAGTIHLAVVDPGVGTARRGLVITARGHVFVGPDNGVFTPLLTEADWQAFELTEPQFRLPRVSQTFHGRDVFAPAAAHVALGVPPSRFGRPVTDPVRLGWAQAHRVAGGVAGRVIHVDRFGNLITSIGAGEVQTLTAGGTAAVRVGGRALPLVGTYAELPPAGAGALVGSRQRLEIAVRDGSAAVSLRARVGMPVVLSRTMRPKTLRSRRGSSSRGA